MGAIALLTGLEEPKSICGRPRKATAQAATTASKPSASNPSYSTLVLTFLDLSIRLNFRATSSGAGTGPGNGS